MKLRLPLFDAPADAGAAAPAPAAATGGSEAPAQAEAAAPKAPAKLNRYGTPVPLDAKPETEAAPAGTGTGTAPGGTSQVDATAEQEAEPTEEQEQEQEAAAEEEAPEQEAKPAEAKEDDAPKVKEPTKAVQSLLGEIRKVAPGLAVSAEALPEVVGEMHAELKELRPIRETLAAVAKEKPQLVALFDEIAGGKSELLALKEHYPDLVRDVEEGDPEYAAFVEAKAEKRVRSEYERQEAERQERKQQRWQSDSQAAFEEFAARMEAEYPGMDRAAFEAEYLSLFSPQHGARFRGDHFDIIARGLASEAREARAVKEAVKTAREEVLAEVRAGKHAPGNALPGQPEAPANDLPPDVAGRGSGVGTGLDPSKLSHDEQRAHSFGRALFPGTRLNRYGTPVPLNGQA